MYNFEILNIYYWNRCQQTESNSLKSVRLFSLLSLRADIFIVSNFSSMFDPLFISHTSFPSSSFNLSVSSYHVCFKDFPHWSSNGSDYFAAAVFHLIHSIQNSHKWCKDPGAGENEIITAMPENLLPCEKTHKDIFNNHFPHEENTLHRVFNIWRVTFSPVNSMCK